MNPLNHQGWQAQLDLEYGLRGRKTCLIRKHQHSPLTLQRSFYPEGDICHNYLLHPPGGVVGGDSLQINASAGSGAHCLLTTPGATKFYRSRDQLLATQCQNLSVAEGAVMEWLPQQNIFFPGANIDLAPYVGADLNVMAKDTQRMRPNSPWVFTNLKKKKGLDKIIEFIVDRGMLRPGKSEPLSECIQASN